MRDFVLLGSGAFHSGCRTPAYRADIDGLRAIAVLSVLLYHAGVPGFGGGFVGVDVFFVISGFLITGIVWREIGSGGFSLQGFYIRRIKRIFPALFAVLALSSLAAFFLLIPSDLIRFGKAANSSVLFYSNFYWLKNTGYFDAPARENPLLHIWSLSVEEQFYAVWPLALLLLSRIASIKKVIYIVVALAFISLVFAEARLPDHQKDAFYLPWCRAWELLMGALLALSPAAVRPARLASVLGGAGLAAIGLAVALYDTSSRFPGLAAILPCGGAALVIAAGSAGNPVTRLLSAEPLRRIGLISYSLYLIHWPLFSFAHLYLGPVLPLALRLCLVLTSFMLAYVSWRFIETPLRKAPFPELGVLGAAAASIGGLVLAGISFSQNGGFPRRADETVRREILALDALQSDLSKYCRRVIIRDVKGDTICEMGADRGGVYDFILWGDSHARHFVPAVGTLAKNRKLSGLLLQKNACHPFLDDSHTSKLCRDFNAAVARWVAGQPIKLVILGGRWRNHLRYLVQFSLQDHPAQNSGGLAKTLAFLNEKGIEVTVLDQTPDFAQNVGDCTARALFYGRSSEECVTQSAAHFISWHRDLDGYFAFLKRQYNFSVASAAEAICGHEWCRARDGSVLLMSDANHLSEAGALRAMPYLNIPLLSGDSGNSPITGAAAELSNAAPRL
jgi:peptidoglycan/LPS O-acetylase OafA/YrhL